MRSRGNPVFIDFSAGSLYLHFHRSTDGESCAATGQSPAGFCAFSWRPPTASPRTPARKRPPRRSWSFIRPRTTSHRRCATFRRKSTSSRGICSSSRVACRRTSRIGWIRSCRDAWRRWRCRPRSSTSTGLCSPESTATARRPTPTARSGPRSTCKWSTRPSRSSTRRAGAPSSGRSRSRQCGRASTVRATSFSDSALRARASIRRSVTRVVWPTTLRARWVREKRLCLRARAARPQRTAAGATTAT